MKIFERRYHSRWVQENGLSPLAQLAAWLCLHKRKNAGLPEAPFALLQAAAFDVATRLPRVAAREPTRRHRKHFTWLLGWHLRLNAVLGSI